VSASIACINCAARADYEPDRLFVSLHEGGFDDVVMLLRFDCIACGRSNTQVIVEEFAMALTEMGATTFVVGPCPELEENRELRAGQRGRLTIGYVETFASMSIDSFNRLLARNVTEGMGNG